MIKNEMDKIKEDLKALKIDNQKIFIITIGKPRIPLEKNTVRFVVNEDKQNKYLSPLYIEFQKKVLSEKLQNEEFEVEKHFIKYLTDENKNSFFVFLKSENFTEFNKVHITPLNFKEKILFMENLKENFNYKEINFLFVSDFIKKLKLLFEFFKEKKQKINFFNLAKIPEFVIPEEEQVEHKIQSNEGDIKIYLKKFDLYEKLIKEYEELILNQEK
jgi:hypothetical protein